MWAVILLMITNAVTVGTILYHNYKENSAAGIFAIQTGAGVNLLNGRFFRQTLGFSAEQMDSFRSINQVFHPSVMILTYGIDSLKTNMFTELQKPVPDTVFLNKMSEQIGNMHGRLKYETWHFYLHVKKICTPAQSLKWEKAFLPMLTTENIPASSEYRRRGLNRN